MMNLAINAGALGGHLAGWRHPDAFPTSTMELDNAVEIATLAERGLFDCLFLADGNGVRQMDKPLLFESNSPSDRPAVFEPVTLFAALSQHTRHIGLVATATTSFEEPFTLARKFASLDHLSGGRAGWNLVTTQYVEDARNFSHDEHLPRDVRYARAWESLAVVRKLWDSWGADAFLQDKASGRFLDSAKVRLAAHKGEHFSVRGPLNVARSPQGQPVVFMAGQSEAGKELAAFGGEALFGTAADMAEARAEYADIKGRMARHGRDPATLRILPGLSIYAGRTAAEAQDLFEELQALVPDPLAVIYLSKVVGQDLSGLDPGGPLPAAPDDPSLGGTAISRSVREMAVRDGLTVRQAARRVLASMSGNAVIGTPSQVVDVMEAWFRKEACDGFVLSVPVQPRSLRDLVELVVPELQRRGLFRTKYAGTTLRANMGLPVPPDPFTTICHDDHPG